MLGGYWKRRAEAAEAKVAQAAQRLTLIDATLKSQTTLISITREGRFVRFLFQRNGELLPITVIGSWDDDISAWQEWAFGQKGAN